MRNRHTLLRIILITLSKCIKSYFWLQYPHIIYSLPRMQLSKLHSLLQMFPHIIRHFTPSSCRIQETSTRSGYNVYHVYPDTLYYHLWQARVEFLCVSELSEGSGYVYVFLLPCYWLSASVPVNWLCPFVCKLCQVISWKDFWVWEAPSSLPYP